jgi:hypothetical protein
MPNTHFAGMFTPSVNSQERVEKCSTGLTTLTAMAILLSTIADIVPKSTMAHFPLLGKNKFKILLVIFFMRISLSPGAFSSS